MRNFNSKQLFLESLERRDLLNGAPTADVTGDGLVDIFDINLVSSKWGTSNPIADANHDSVVDIFDINLISSNWGQMPHTTDAVKQDEHLALMQLLPRTEATDIAIRDGDWDTPSTWYDGTVPTASDKVLLVSDVTLSHSTVISWLRVESYLTLGPNSSITAGTIVGTSTSHLVTAGGHV